MTPQCKMFLHFLEIHLDSGKKNGDIKASWKSLEYFGLEYRTIKDTINEAINAGYVERTVLGKGRTASRFRLIKLPRGV
jgi:hypothetical protein